MKRRILLSCCLIFLTSTSSVASPASVAFAQSSNRPAVASPLQSFQSQIYSRASLEIASGSESARLKSELYAVNPFDSVDYDHKFYNKVVDSLVRISTILENEEASRKLKISTNNTNIPSAASSAFKLAFPHKIQALCTQVVKDYLALDSQYQARLGSLVSSGEGLKKQMTSSGGSNKVSGSGTTMYVRNYVNFGGVDQSPSSLIVPAVAPPVSLIAVPGRLGQPSGRRQLRSRP